MIVAVDYKTKPRIIVSPVRLGGVLNLAGFAPVWKRSDIKRMRVLVHKTPCFSFPESPYGLPRIDLVADQLRVLERNIILIQ